MPILCYPLKFKVSDVQGCHDVLFLQSSHDIFKVMTRTAKKNPMFKCTTAAQRTEIQQGT